MTKEEKRAETRNSSRTMLDITIRDIKRQSEFTREFKKYEETAEFYTSLHKTHICHIVLLKSLLNRDTEKNLTERLAKYISILRQTFELIDTIPQPERREFMREYLSDKLEPMELEIFGILIVSWAKE